MLKIITGGRASAPLAAGGATRILAELDEPGAKFAEVARRQEVSRGLLRQ
ncbi:MAG: hypothetical protein IRZ13_16425 [Acetobacteraceae bacterium]|nr:hypothetical protein [Acetobacteraceae bacterium]